MKTFISLSVVIGLLVCVLITCFVLFWSSIKQSGTATIQLTAPYRSSQYPKSPRSVKKRGQRADFRKLPTENTALEPVPAAAASSSTKFDSNPASNVNRTFNPKSIITGGEPPRVNPKPTWRNLHVDSSHPLKSKNQISTITIHSSLRDIQQYPSSNFYQFVFDTPFHNVTQIQIIDGIFNASEQVVHENACWLDFQFESENSTDHSIRLLSGTYQFSLAELVAQLHASLSKYNIGVHFDENVEQVTFSSGEKCKLQFGTGEHANQSLWRQLGFPASDTDMLLKHVSTNKPDISGTSVVQVVCDELLNTPNYVLATLLLKKNKTIYIPQSHEMMWPIARLSAVTLQLQVEQKNYLTKNIERRNYHTGGLDHTFALLVQTRVPENTLLEEVELEP